MMACNLPEIRNLPFLIQIESGFHDIAGFGVIHFAEVNHLIFSYNID